VEQTKVCYKCGDDKELYSFNNDRYSKDGLDKHCRSCREKEYERTKYRKLYTHLDYCDQEKAVTERIIYEKLQEEERMKPIRLEIEEKWRLRREYEDVIKLDLKIKEVEKLIQSLTKK
jgi:hypothetical protein